MTIYRCKHHGKPSPPYVLVLIKLKNFGKLNGLDLTWTEPCAASAIFDTMLSRWTAALPISIVLTVAHRHHFYSERKTTKENVPEEKLWTREEADKIDSQNMLLLLNRCQKGVMICLASCSTPDEFAMFSLKKILALWKPWFSLIILVFVVFFYEIEST